MGPDHVPTTNSLVYSFCNSLWSKAEEKSGSSIKDIKHVKDMGIQKTAVTDCQENTGKRSYYAGVIRVSGLHNLLNHHRPNREDIQVSASNIAK